MLGMDDACGGRRGLRATVTSELVDLLRDEWGLVPGRALRDLGGSANLNVLVGGKESQFVARVYRPFIMPGRLAGLQIARRTLASHGLPVMEPIPTVGGRPWSHLDNRLVELEPFIPSTSPMRSIERVAAALPLLGRAHSALADLRLGAEAASSEFSNYVPYEELPARVAVGTRRIRSWHPTAEESRLADAADHMAEVLTQLQQRSQDAAEVQLVHGDFWDTNVLFRDDEVVLIGDFDFMGERPRVDDLALTLYFVSQDIADLTEDPPGLTALLDAYASRLDKPLSAAEREAIPIAMARQPLWSIAVWVALLDDEVTARRHLAGTASALDWGVQFTNSLLWR